MVFEYRPLKSPANWINFHLAKKNPILQEPNLEYGAFVVLHSLHELHETVGLPAQSLNESWLSNDQFYLADDRSALPPLACMPIYIISVGSGESERVVYIGKTTSRSSRFIAGHKAMALLHAPQYERLKKSLYTCCVVLLSNENHEIPIEWITPYQKGKEMLTLFEKILIYHFQPELNVNLKKKPTQTLLNSIHIQNITYKTSFLRDVIIGP